MLGLLPIEPSLVVDLERLLGLFDHRDLSSSAISLFALLPWLSEQYRHRLEGSVRVLKSSIVRALRLGADQPCVPPRDSPFYLRCHWSC